MKCTECTISPEKPQYIDYLYLDNTAYLQENLRE